MTTIEDYKHPIADSIEAFCDALDQRPEVVDRILDDVLIERDGQHAPPGEAKVFVPSFGAVFGAESREPYEGAD